jgi:hypothetical protein
VLIDLSRFTVKQVCLNGFTSEILKLLIRPHKLMSSFAPDVNIEARKWRQSYIRVVAERMIPIVGVKRPSMEVRKSVTGRPGSAPGIDCRTTCKICRHDYRQLTTPLAPSADMEEECRPCIGFIKMDNRRCG